MRPVAHLGDMTNATTARRLRPGRVASAALAVTLLSGCAALSVRETPAGIEPVWRFPVTSNDTPYSRCLASLAAQPGDNLPTVAVGEVADKTGQFNANERGFALSQGASEMVVSAFFKTRKVRLVERLDLRVVNQELNLRKGKLVDEPLQAGAMRGADFVAVGALTELNYNIVSDGAGLWIGGVGAGGKGVVVNVALDLRLINARTLDVVYVSSVQKQIVGHEIEANIFRFFNSTLVELDAGQVRNEPLQLGVRSVSEMAVHQVMTDFLGLPATPECRLVEDGAMARKSLSATDQGVTK
jgi:curli production assembly/transport component CsgG/holdfast attachment protein HfaB